MGGCWNVLVDTANFDARVENLQQHLRSLCVKHRLCKHKELQAPAAQVQFTTYAFVPRDDTTVDHSPMNEIGDIDMEK